MNVISPKKSGVEGKRNGFNKLPILFLVLFLFAAGAHAQKSTFDGSTLDHGAQLMERYQTVGTAFWNAENLRNAQTPTPAQRKVLLTPPIPESHPAHPKYFQAAVAADSFLKLADENKIHNWMCDPVLYFGGISHFSLGNYTRAEVLFSRLSPNYLRDYYINDRDPVNPEFSTPTKPGISKLLFFCQRIFPKNRKMRWPLSKGSPLKPKVLWRPKQSMRTGWRTAEAFMIGVSFPNQISAASPIRSAPALCRVLWSYWKPPGMVCLLRLSRKAIFRRAIICGL